MAAIIEPAWKETDRLEAVEAYGILDTPREKEFDDIARLAAQVLDMPISLISFLQSDRQWFKARVGLEVCETPRDISICTHAILQPGVLVVPDTTKDPRFQNNPLVTGEPHLRFYAGALLETSDGLPLGTMCVLDHKPREFSREQEFVLETLARQVMTQLDLRRALKEKVESEERLERTVEERTNTLRASMAELEAFSYTISHDMRAPLRAMLGFSEILQEEYGPQLDEQANRFLGRIRAASARMDNLIQDVLSFSRMSRIDLPMEPLDTLVVIREIVESYPNLRASEVGILLPQEMPRVMANPAALTQCVSNLLGNAVKFVAPGVKPVVRIWAQEAGGRVKLWFKDNGIGIKEEDFQRIFDVFQRLDRKHEGTGIGLAIVKKAAERMGGHVGVESTPAQGASFWLDLQAA